MRVKKKSVANFQKVRSLVGSPARRCQRTSARDRTSLLGGSSLTVFEDKSKVWGAHISVFYSCTRKLTSFLISSAPCYIQHRHTKDIDYIDGTFDAPRCSGMISSIRELHACLQHIFTDSFEVSCGLEQPCWDPIGLPSSRNCRHLFLFQS